MNKKRIIFIYNPVSGRSRIKTCLSDIISILSEADYVVECYPTRGQGDTRRYVGRLENEYCCIACAGGDGTLNQIVSGIVDNAALNGIPVGYIPLGTTNDFANGLKIPSDPLMAARAIVEGRTFSCDLGRFNDKNYFTYVAAFGMFTETSYETPQELKNTIGQIAYYLQGIAELGNLRTYRMRVETDEETFEDDFAYGMVTNALSVGGFGGIQGRDVDLQDGMFEATLIRMPANLLEISELLQYLSGGIPESPLVWHRKLSRITLHSEEKVRWTRDGEKGGAFKKVVLENLPGRLFIKVP